VYFANTPQPSKAEGMRQPQITERSIAKANRVIPVWLARASFSRIFSSVVLGCPRRLGEFFEIWTFRPKRSNR
jgi:hypothetical protein